MTNSGSSGRLVRFFKSRRVCYGLKQPVDESKVRSFAKTGLAEKIVPANKVNTKAIVNLTTIFFISAPLPFFGDRARREQFFPALSFLYALGGNYGSCASAQFAFHYFSRYCIFFSRKVADIGNVVPYGQSTWIKISAAKKDPQHLFFPDIGDVLDDP